MEMKDWKQVGTVEIDSGLSRIPRNDKLRKRAWEIVRDWMDANE